MADYIEREALIRDIGEAVRFTVRDGTPSAEIRGANKIIDRIYSAPTADVVEVKHGEWLQTKEPLGYKDVDCIECSACRDSWIIDEDFDFEFHKQYWNYCPNCGAKMDGKDINVPTIDGKRSETNAE